MPITLVRKRSGLVVDFDRSRVESAISRAYQASKVLIDIVSLSELVDNVVRALEEGDYGPENIPDVETIQNIVEKAIAEKGDFEVAKAYILYREERNKERKRDLFKKRVHLNRSYQGLYVCPMIWRELDNFSSGSVCLVLASNLYSEDDYYRNKHDFMKKRWE